MLAWTKITLFISLVSLHCLHCASIRSVPDSYPETKSPNEIEDSGASVEGKILKVPAECRNQSYCLVKPANYPQQKFDEYVKKLARSPGWHVPVSDEEKSQNGGNVENNVLHKNDVTVLQVPIPCRNQTYCLIKPPDYPQKAFNILISHLVRNNPVGVL